MLEGAGLKQLEAKRYPSRPLKIKGGSAPSPDPIPKPIERHLARNGYN